MNFREDPGVAGRREAAALRKHRPDDGVERQLDLAWSLRALGRGPDG